MLLLYTSALAGHDPLEEAQESDLVGYKRIPLDETAKCRYVLINM